VYLSNDSYLGNKWKNLGKGNVLISMNLITKYLSEEADS